MTKDINAFFHLEYFGFRKEKNPDFINLLKNTFDNESDIILKRSIEWAQFYFNDLFKSLTAKHLNIEIVVVMVPRALAETQYTNAQRGFKLALQQAIKSCNNKNIIDGVDLIKRVVSTQTTHLQFSEYHQGQGDLPYVGITKDTCSIDSNRIKGKNIILIDDIYTKL